MDDLEANGIVSEQDGAKPRDVLISAPEEEEEPYDQIYSNGVNKKGLKRTNCRRRSL